MRLPFILNGGGPGCHWKASALGPDVLVLYRQDYEAVTTEGAAPERAYTLNRVSNLQSRCID